jgi:hypothetical protein
MMGGEPLAALGSRGGCRMYAGKWNYGFNAERKSVLDPLGSTNSGKR